MAEGAPWLQRLDQLLEGQVGMAKGAQAALAHASQQGAEGGGAVQAGAQGQGVDEEADHALQLPLGAPGDGGADDHSVLTRIAAQQRLEGRQQQHEQGDTLRLRQRPQLHRQVGWEQGTLAPRSLAMGGRG